MSFPTYRDMVNKRFAELVGARFRNNQAPRMSGQEFGADARLNSLSFWEFVESYFGEDRLDVGWSGDDEDEFELEHMGNVLFDNVLKGTKVQAIHVGGCV